MRDLSAENKTKKFYDSEGWSCDNSGISADAKLWEDLRPCAMEYVSACRKKINKFLPEKGEYILDAASGPIQYPEYLEYSEGFTIRVCVDISQQALAQAKTKLGNKGEYVCSSILELPFPDNYFDAIVSLHTIYHIEKNQQADAVRQMIRVAKNSIPLIIVYANPDRFFSRIKRLLRTHVSPARQEPLYYYAHPLSWWEQFRDECDIKMLPWRSLAVKESLLLVPNNLIGKIFLKLLLWMESSFPNLMTRSGAYPMIILTKKRSTG